MCRHLAYLGPPAALWSLVGAPPRGLYEQSWAPRRQTHGVVNADGFGLGWYPAGERDEPARYRRAVPIWADPNVPELARAIRSHAVLAAVRSATAGTALDEAAAAPFRDGRFLFSHNGAVADWTTLPADLAAAGREGSGCTAAVDGAVRADGPAGTNGASGSGGVAQLDAEALLSLEARSDSALIWALICSRLRRRARPEDVLADVVRAIAAVRPQARLNLLLTDGRTIVATRHGDTLWYRMGRDAVTVASEPDEEDTDYDWHEVPDHSLLLATQAGVSEAVKL
jgi:predicted glutamine amidotransferase